MHGGYQQGQVEKITNIYFILVQSAKKQHNQEVFWLQRTQAPCSLL